MAQPRLIVADPANAFARGRENALRANLLEQNALQRKKDNTWNNQVRARKRKAWTIEDRDKELLSKIDLVKPYTMNKEAISQLSPDRQAQILEYYAKNDKRERERHKEFGKFSMELGKRVLPMVKGPESYALARKAILDATMRSGLVSEQEIKDQLLPAFPEEYNQEWVQSRLAVYGYQPEKPDYRTVSPGTQLYKDGKLVATNPKHTGNDITEQDLTPDALDNIATRYNIDGTLPPLGMKAGPIRKKILNRAAELLKGTGMTSEEARIFQIGTSVNKTALAQLKKQKTIVGAFEKNFVKNADLAMGLSKKVDRSGVPIVNKWVNAGKRSIAGDPEISAFDTSLKAVVNEYTKIISGSMGNTQMAEGEVKKVERLLNAAQTPEQVEAVIAFMKLETQNRMKGFDEQEKELVHGMKLPSRERQQVGSNNQEPSQGTAPPNAAFGGVNPETGQMEYFDSQGNKI